MPTVRMTRGKYEGINALANREGVIAALAMDQRGSLSKAIASAMGAPATENDMMQFKSLVTEVLAPHASAVLLDPEFGLEAAHRRGPDCGLLLAYEKTGYDVEVRGRIPDLLPQWSALRLVEAGANGIKLLLYYDPDDDLQINTVKEAFLERVGAECRASDVPLFLEAICYSDATGNSAATSDPALAFARVKPGKVAAYMREFSQSRYGVDVLKVEVPVDMRLVAGTRANAGGPAAYTREQAQEFLRQAAAEARKPFIYLSAGVTDEVFRETLELAAEAGTPFSGVLCGRATWQMGVPEYGRGGAAALRAWLEGAGVENIEALNEVVSHGARPWWDFYGGIDNIQIVDRQE